MSQPYNSLHGQRTFTGRGLSEIAFPLGGIGTGNVSLGGRGNLRDWEIFNHPGKGVTLPYTFFSVWAKPEGGSAVARVLEGRIPPPYAGQAGPMNIGSGFGLPPHSVSGLPRFRDATFSGAYPFARLNLEDSRFPLRAELNACTPFVPLDADASGIPCAILNWTLYNDSDIPMEASLAFSLLNVAGYDGLEVLGNRHCVQFGGNRNEWREESGLRGIFLTGGKARPDDPKFGSLAVSTTWQGGTTHSLRWERAGWWDDLQNFWDDFSTDGELPNHTYCVSSPDGQTDVGTLVLRATIPARDSVTLPFVLTWHFPNLRNTWNTEEAVHGKPLANYYGARFGDAWKVAEYLKEGGDRLERETKTFAAAFFDSTLPVYMLDAVSSQMSIIRTTTCMRTDDGMFHAFEGCGDTWGCCPMNCTHVWNYEQSLAFLFPSLERTMRLTDFANNTQVDGRMAFRTLLPMAPDVLWNGPPAADGQMGAVLKLYREWKISGDRDFLKTLWPSAKSALEYAWRKWDIDRDGVMEGEQHNTYDIEFYGPNTMMGTLYLAALRAGAEIALALSDPVSAAEYQRLCESGRATYDDLLWNGEYFVQKIVPPAKDLDGLGGGIQSMQASGELRYQYGSGCLSDQLLGQWFARVVGLRDVLPPGHVKSALAAIFQHNFRETFEDHVNCQRIYALNDEAGLLLCSWPREGRETYPFPYADEVWTGIEYQVAAHMIYEGLVEEGLTIVRAVRDRYAGFNRNPWDEVECGHHYARAMASYSLLTALSGFRYDAVLQTLEFNPRLPGRFKSFFAAGTGWGVFEADGDGGGELRLEYGHLTLRQLTVNGESTIWGQPRTITAGDALSLTTERQH